MGMFPVLSIVRFLAPFIILRAPLLGVVLCSIIDIYDWKLLGIKNQDEYNFYQHWDKFFDTYYLLMAYLSLSSWKDKLAKNIASSLFLYRIFGVVAYYITGYRQLLFFFPNFFENFFVMYLLYVRLTKDEIFFHSAQEIVIFMSCLVVPKLFHELTMHVFSLQPWQIIDIGKILHTTGIVAEYTNYLVWGSLLYLIPLGSALLYLRSNRVSHSH